MVSGCLHVGCVTFDPLGGIISRSEGENQATTVLKVRPMN